MATSTSNMIEYLEQGVARARMDSPSHSYPPCTRIGWHESIRSASDFFWDTV